MELLQDSARRGTEITDPGGVVAYTGIGLHEKQQQVLIPDTVMVAMMMAGVFARFERYAA